MSRKSFMVVFNDDLNIGNFSENLHYTLFKAERLNKKVKLIRKRMFFEKFLKKFLIVSSLREYIDYMEHLLILIIR